MQVSIWAFEIIITDYEKRTRHIWRMICSVIRLKSVIMVAKQKVLAFRNSLQIDMPFSAINFRCLYSVHQVHYGGMQPYSITNASLKTE